MSGSLSALRSGRTSSESLVREALDRADGLNPALLALQEIHHTAAIAAARRRDAELRAGKDRGPLHGIPCVVKDVFHMRGWDVTYGSSALAPVRAGSDAAMVRMLRTAGAVIIATARTYELAIGLPAPGDAAAVRSSTDPRLSPGGSSSGSAVAVSGGIVPVAIGTDTGGSTRGPASWCGVVGFKPSRDLLPVRGMLRLSPRLDHVGLFAGSVADMRLVARALGIPDDAGPPAGPTTFGVARDLLTPGSADTKVLEHFNNLLDRLSTHGSRLVTVRWPDPRTIEAAYRVHVARELFDQHHDLLLDPRLGADTRARIAAGAGISARAAHAALRSLDRIASFIDDELRSVDVALSPATPTAAPQVAGLRPGGPLSPFAVPFNISGGPSVSIPMGTCDGAPVGVLISGRQGADATVIKTAEFVERVLRTSADECIQWSRQVPGGLDGRRSGT